MFYKEIEELLKSIIFSQFRCYLLAFLGSTRLFQCLNVALDKLRPVSRLKFRCTGEFKGLLIYLDVVFAKQAS